MPADDHPALRRFRWAFGEHLRALRRAQGLTQEQLGNRAAGMDKKTISRIENGHHSASLETIALLAWGLGLPPERLFTGLPPPDLSDAPPPGAG